MIRGVGRRKISDVIFIFVGTAKLREEHQICHLKGTVFGIFGFEAR
jgi:hypothetical protein